MFISLSDLKQLLAQIEQIGLEAKLINILDSTPTTLRGAEIFKCSVFNPAQIEEIIPYLISEINEMKVFWGESKFKENRSEFCRNEWDRVAALKKKISNIGKLLSMLSKKGIRTHGSELDKLKEFSGLIGHCIKKPQYEGAPEEISSESIFDLLRGSFFKKIDAALISIQNKKAFN